eukprot:m.226831 g.226831  ORF g.226831 m.226831 type:complete len:1081 (-) comp33503_c0_seq1:276-3518(-)
MVEQQQRLRSSSGSRSLTMATMMIFLLVLPASLVEARKKTTKVATKMSTTETCQDESCFQNQYKQQESLSPKYESVRELLRQSLEMINVTDLVDKLPPKSPKNGDPKDAYLNFHCESNSEGFWYSQRLLENDLESRSAAVCGIKTIVTQMPIRPGLVWLSGMLRQYGREDLAITAEKLAAQSTEVPLGMGIDWFYVGAFEASSDNLNGDPVWKAGGPHKLARTSVVRSSLTGPAKWLPVRTIDDDSVVDIRPFRYGRGKTTNGFWRPPQQNIIWSGWGRGHFFSPKRQNISVLCTGTDLFYVNDEPFVGDLYGNTNQWVTTEVDEGMHVVSTRILSSHSLQFRCNVKEPSAPEAEVADYIVHDPPFLPDLVEGLLLTGGFPIPITNLHPTLWMRNIRIVVSGRQWTINQTKWAVAPGQTHLLQVHLTGMPTLSGRGVISPAQCVDDGSGTSTASFELRIASAGFPKKKLPIVLACRKSFAQSFTFTYLDNRGSLRHGAAMAPQYQCPYYRCCVAVSFQVPGYLPQVQTEFYGIANDSAPLMGLQHTWIATLALGLNEHHISQYRTTIVAATKALETISLNRIFCYTPGKCQIIADPNRLLLTGHGEGGWLSILAASTMPDRVLGVIAVAPRYESSQVGSLAKVVDPTILQTLQRQRGSRTAEGIGNNLEGVPIYLFAFENDTEENQNQIWEISEALLALNGNVTIDTIDGKSSWFNEPGLMEPLRHTPLFDNTIKSLMRLLCDAEIQAYTPSVYKMKVQDPTQIESKGGIVISRMCARDSPASISLAYTFNRTDGKHRALMKTKNVCELQFAIPAGLEGSPGGSAFDWENTSHIEVDGHVLEPYGKLYGDATFNRFCAESSRLLSITATPTQKCVWIKTNTSNITLARRRPWGGLGAVLSEPVTIVFSSTNAMSQRIAAAYATQLAISLLVSVSLVSDVDFEAADPILKYRNLIIFGSPENNLLLKNTDVRHQMKKIWPGYISEESEVLCDPTRNAATPDSGVLMLSPSPVSDHRLAMVVTSCSDETLVHLGLLLQNIEDFPDYVVFDETLMARGWHAVSKLGHWESNWNLSPHLSGENF